MSRRRSNYGLEEVRRIVESYVELKARADTNAAGLRTLVLVIDLERALRWLPRHLRGPVLLHGLIGLDQEATAKLLQISNQAVSKRYRDGLELLHFHMNGGYSF